MLVAAVTVRPIRFVEKEIPEAPGMSHGCSPKPFLLSFAPGWIAPGRPEPPEYVNVMRAASFRRQRHGTASDVVLNGGAGGPAPPLPGGHREMGRDQTCHLPFNPISGPLCAFWPGRDGVPPGRAGRGRGNRLVKGAMPIIITATSSSPRGAPCGRVLLTTAWISGASRPSGERILLNALPSAGGSPAFPRCGNLVARPAIPATAEDLRHRRPLRQQLWPAPVGGQADRTSPFDFITAGGTPLSRFKLRQGGCFWPITVRRWLRLVRTSPVAGTWPSAGPAARHYETELPDSHDLPPASPISRWRRESVNAGCWSVTPTAPPGPGRQPPVLSLGRSRVWMAISPLW